MYPDQVAFDQSNPTEKVTVTVLGSSVGGFTVSNLDNSLIISGAFPGALVPVAGNDIIVEIDDMRNPSISQGGPSDSFDIRTTNVLGQAIER